VVNVLITLIFSLQERYSEEFMVFKPDKKLRWLPHLGTMSLNLQFEDRAIETDVPPLEAAFIELFSEKRAFRVPFLLSLIGYTC